MTDLSIVIVTYNSADWIERCLGSLPAALAGREAEVIVVDNASADDSARLAARPGVTVVTNEWNVGFAAAVNQGARLAHSDWLLLLNPDTESRPGALDALLSFAQAHPGHGIYGGRTLSSDGTLEPGSCWELPTLWSTTCFALGLSSLFKSSSIFDPEAIGGWRRDTVREVGMVSGCLLLVERRMWERLGGFDERYLVYGEDTDLNTRARSMGLRPVVTPDCEVVHAVSASAGGNKMPLLLAGKITYLRTGIPRGRRLAVWLFRSGVWARMHGSRLTARGEKWRAAWGRRDEWWDGFPPRPTARSPHVLLVVQNLPVPLDRRVWLECRALRANGYDVSVICPKGPGDKGREELDGVHIYRYRPAPAARGAAGYLREFVYSWLRTAVLSVRVWRRRPFEVLQACNPPDTYWALARLWKRRGVRFVFDHHDLNPELFLSRFGTPSGLVAKLQLRGLEWLERRTFATADHVISTNDSYRHVALTRGGLQPSQVSVVRSGPDTRTMRPIYPPSPRRRRFELAYLGIMGPQDRVDLILDLMDELVSVRGRADVHVTLMGFGDCLAELQADCSARGLDDVVTFTGRADAGTIAEVLSGADVGLGPDPRTPLNDVSTMNKTMEYMAHALPSVAFDLTETRVTAGDTALFVESGDIASFADAVESLLDDEDLRLDVALRARSRVARTLDWRAQAREYVGVFNRLVGSTAAVVEPPPSGSRGHGADLLVDLDDPVELRRFILDRGACYPDVLRPAVGL